MQAFLPRCDETHQTVGVTPSGALHQAHPLEPHLDGLRRRLWARDVLDPDSSVSTTISCRSLIALAMPGSLPAGT